MRLSDRKNNAPIPYRDSKLTRLLQPALEGDSKVSIIVNISPCSDAYDETLSTLKFAQRAKKIKQTITRNELPNSKALLTKYQQEIHLLQEKLKEMEARMVFEENSVTQLTLNSQLIHLQEEKEKVDSRLESILQEKLQLANDLERLKSFIIHSEDVKPTKLISNRKEDLLHSHTLRDRRVASMGNNEKIRGIERRESLLINGIENIELELEPKGGKNPGSMPSYEECIRIIQEQARVIEEFKEMEKEDEENEAIIELKKELEEKDEEIEQLKDELQLCRNNLTKLQLMHRYKRLNSDSSS